MARVFLKNGDTYTVSNANTSIFGSTFAETLVLTNTATNTLVNSNVDTIQFEGNLVDYKFAIQGTNLLVTYNGSMLATLGIQTDSNGTELKFSDITTSVILTGLGVATLGKSSLTSTANSYTKEQITGMTTATVTTTPWGFANDSTAVNTQGNRMKIILPLEAPLSQRESHLKMPLVVV
jgi:hypothetical protein